jgi:hypothetical protein
LNENPRVRSAIPWLCLLLCAPALSARMATVRTRAGEAFEGHARLTRQGVLIVNSAKNLVLTVPGTALSEIAFADDPPPLRDEVVSEALPAGWRELEIGSSRTAGSTRVEQSTFTVRGAGKNIGGEADSFHYVFIPVSGDRDIIARISSVQQTDPGALAALMMRESVGEYSRNVSVGVTPGGVGFFQTRYFEGRATETSSRSDVRAGAWFKLRRRGMIFTAYRSSNGRIWTQVEQATVPMRDEYYVGLAVASAREGMLNWTTFDHVREGAKLVNTDFTPQIELTSGSVISGRVFAMDRKEVQFFRGPRIAPIPTSRVARISFQPLTFDMSWKSRASRPGVWMPGGDFFEGDFQRIEGSKLLVSSVLYGIRAFDVDEDILALVLANPSRARAAVEVDARDGSFLLGTEFACGDGEMILREPALGEVRLPAFQIRELRAR